MNGPDKAAGGSQRRVAFKLHHNLINHLVDRQAATPEKALMELIMNACDAGASRVDITISEGGFTLTDNGKGFQSEQDIEEFFATFGTPQETDKAYGRYRVGRAQIFGWAKTDWKSNGFHMTVDLESDQQGFELTPLAPEQPGCRIEGTWTERAEAMGGIYVHHLVGALTNALLYPPLEIWINGNLVAKPVAEQEWTSQTNDAYFRLSTFGPLRLYNQGVFVCEFAHSAYHVGGVVVTKVAVELTMARNEPLTYSVQWHGIAKHLKEEADRLHEAGASVGTDEFRSFALRKALMGEGGWDAACITVIPKAHVTLETFTGALLQTKTLVYSSRGDLGAVEKSVRDNGIRAAMLHFDSVERLRSVLGVSYAEEDEDVVLEFLNHLEVAAERDLGIALPQIKIYSAASLPEPKGGGEILPSEALSGAENEFIRGVGPDLLELAFAMGEHPRGMCVAKTDGDTVAFTDGVSYIAFDRKLIQDVCSLKRGAVAKFVMTYVHEMCHKEDSRNAGHDDVFHSTFHEIATTHADLVEDAMERVVGLARMLRHSWVRTPSRADLGRAWWQPQVARQTRWSRRNDCVRVMNKALDELSEGKLTAEECKGRVESFIRDTYSWKWDDFLEDKLSEGESARPLRLVGDARSLQRIAPFDRYPTRQMLTTFMGKDWQPFSVETSYLNEWSNESNIAWHKVHMGKVVLRSKDVQWKPGRSAPTGFPTHFNALAEKHAEGFPWSERDFHRDLVWAMLARLTIALWCGQQCDAFTDSALWTRVRFPGDPPGTCIVLTASSDRFSDKEPLLDDWMRAIKSRYPDILFLSSEQLLNEALDAFADDAESVASDAECFGFWLKWMGS